jgi:hemoglobin-like flavoprotein
MTPDQIKLVQDSFRTVAPLRVAVAAQFYTNLFALDPAIARMFSGTDLTGQGAKLMTALAMVVQGLTRPETILPMAADMGRRHRGYGVKDRHYATVGVALLETLSNGLGPAFTPDTRDAWAAAYALLSGVMMEAAQEAQPAGMVQRPVLAAAAS